MNKDEEAEYQAGEWTAAVAKARRLGARREERLGYGVALLMIFGMSAILWVALWGAARYLTGGLP